MEEQLVTTSSNEAATVRLEPGSATASFAVDAADTQGHSCGGAELRTFPGCSLNTGPLPDGSALPNMDAAAIDASACNTSAPSEGRAAAGRKKKKGRPCWLNKAGDSPLARPEKSSKSPDQSVAAPAEFEQPNLRKGSDRNYAEPRIRGMPYSQHVGTVCEQLRFDTTKVLAYIEDICDGPWMEEKKAELIKSLSCTPEFQEHQQPAPEYEILARGIQWKWRDLIDRGLGHSSVGRIAANTLAEGVASGITDADRLAADGRLTRLYNLLSMSRSVIRHATDRMTSAEAIALLDPSRTLRKDALQGDELRKVLSIWETHTRPEPAMGLLMRIKCGVGEYVTHALHWQEKRTEDLHEILIRAWRGRRRTFSMSKRRKDVRCFQMHHENAVCMQ